MAKKEKITQGGQSSANIVQLSQVRKFNVDIEDFITSVQSAENIEHSRRARLYDLYEDVMQDPHLESVIGKRKARLHSAPIRFQKKDGQYDEAMDDIIKAPWFTSFLDDCLDAKFYGFSLFQFDRGADGYVTYELINRKHVNPIDRLIMKQQYDTAGLPFDNFFNLLLVGKPRDLGVLSKVTPYVIYKRNAMGDWSQFAELFGMPVREYTYDASDDEARQRLLNDAQEQGAASVYIHPNDATMKLVEAAGKTASVDVYDKFINRLNAEISKCVLGNTLSTESSENGTQSLGTVQKQGEDDISNSDRKYVLDVLNYDLTDIFSAMGINTAGGEFIYEESEDKDIEKQMRIVQGLWQMGLPMSDDYLYKKFGVDKPDNGEGLKRKEVNEDGEGGKQDSPKKEEEEDGDDAPKEPQKKEEEKDSLWQSFFNRWVRFFV